MMADREKVIEWLNDIHAVACGIGEDQCYLNSIGIKKLQTLINDATELLRAQEPRVMSLEEVLNAENTAEPLWCEFIDCALGSWRMGWKLKTKGKREVQHILENPLERAIVWESEYEKGWRCWTSRPTNVQKEAVKWE